MSVYVLSGVIGLLVLTLAFCVFCLARAGRLLNEYEQFYQSNLEDVELQLNMFHRLLKENDYIANDEQVKEAFRAMREFYKTLLGFYNARKVEKAKRDGKLS